MPFPQLFVHVEKMDTQVVSITLSWVFQWHVTFSVPDVLVNRENTDWCKHKPQDIKID